MGRQLKDVYGNIFSEMAKLSHASKVVDETKVYEEANYNTQKYVFKIAQDWLLPGSGLRNKENFKAFYDAVTKEGKSGLILVEHYSNFDLPGFVYLLESSEEEWEKDLGRRIVSIAGIKLNEATIGTRVVAGSFSRVIVYPTRSKEALASKGLSEEEIEAEQARAKKINFAAMRAMDQCKKRGQVILAFPTGTRYRPGKPETKRGLREMDSYLRLFDCMILVSINGNCLRINPENSEDMMADIVEKDVLTYTASPVINCKEFRNAALAKVPENCEDPKQFTVDTVMKYMEDQHNAAEAGRKVKPLANELSETTYPGRGIIAGKSEDGKYAISAYWTMGRSAGSRNRIFVTEKDGDGEVIKTKAFDEKLIAGDPSLIIYSAVRQLGSKTIVTNGEQTDTIYDGMKNGQTFEQSLRSRKYEHDAPNYTPRISSLIDIEGGKLNYSLSILKSDDGNPDNTLRQTFNYDNPESGEGRYIHTYMGDGNPLPSFEGEPVRVKLEGDIEKITETIWNALNEDNKVSLFVRFIDIESGKYETRIINKNKGHL